MRGIQSVNDPNQIPSTEKQNKNSWTSLEMCARIAFGLLDGDIESGTNFSFLEVKV